MILDITHYHDYVLMDWHVFHGTEKISHLISENVLFNLTIFQIHVQKVVYEDNELRQLILFRRLYI